MDESSLTLEKFLQHYGITMEDVERAKMNGIYQKGRWLLVYNPETNKITLWKNPDSCILPE